MWQVPNLTRWLKYFAIHWHGLDTDAYQNKNDTIYICVFDLFVWFHSLHPFNNLSVIKGRVFLGWTSTKLGLIFLLKDTTQWRRWSSNPRPFGLESSTLPLSHCTPYYICVNEYTSYPKTMEHENEAMLFWCHDITGLRLSLTYQCPC